MTDHRRQTTGSLQTGCGLVLVLLLSPAVHAASFEFTGLLEGESAYTETTAADGTKTRAGKNYLATAEFALGAVLTEHWRADLVLLAEDVGNTDKDDYLPTPGATAKRPDRMHVETLTVGYTPGAVQITAGRMALPFGNFDTAVLSDPQTLELGETKTEFGAVVATEVHGVELNLGAFNGNFRETTPDRRGISLGAVWEAGSNWTVGAGYLSALANLHATGRYGPWTLLGEYLGAVRERGGANPAAYSLDLGYSHGKHWRFGARHQQTRRLGVLTGGDGYYREWAASTTAVLTERLRIGIEYLHGTEGEIRQRQALMRVALSF